MVNNEEMQRFIEEQNAEKKASTPCLDCKNASFLRYKKCDESAKIADKKEIEEFDQSLVRIRCNHWREFVENPHLIEACDGFSHG